MENLQVFLPGWETVRCIGSGSSGKVYELKKKDEYGGDFHSALKVISIPSTQKEYEEMESTMSEFAMRSKLRDKVEEISGEYRLMGVLRGHPNIVNCEDQMIIPHENDLGWDIYIRMELLKPLKLWLTDRYDERQVIRLGLNMCGALHGCHQRNIIHRDIKPENILVTEEGKFKLGDFGIAKVSEKTATGTLTGTYSYMAPEIANRQHYGTSADIYSLGLVMYWMMNERTLPFLPLGKKIPSGVQRQEAQDRRFSGEEIPAPINGSLGLTRIVLKACAFDPKERYHTVQELAEELKQCYRNTHGVTVWKTVSVNSPKEVPAFNSSEREIEQGHRVHIKGASQPLYRNRKKSRRNSVIFPLFILGTTALLLLLVCTRLFLISKPVIETATPTSSLTETVSTEPETTETTSIIPECEDVYLMEEVPTLTTSGQSFLLDVRTVPEEVANEIFYYSSDTKVVTVSGDGLLEARGSGEAAITIGCGSASATYGVTVRFEEDGDESSRIASEYDDQSYYQINCFEDLANIRNDLNGHYVLMCDLYISDAPMLQPIGEGSFSFSQWSAKGGFAGTLDGNGHRIVGLQIQSDRQCTGLFASIAPEGVVKNLSVEATVTVTTENDNNALAVIAGYNEGLIENCDVDIKASGKGMFVMAAGIAGCNGGIIRYCQATGSINAKGEYPKVASITGLLTGNGTVSQCVALVRNENSPARLRALAVDEGKTAVLLGTARYTEEEYNPNSRTKSIHTYEQATLGASFNNANSINKVLNNARQEALGLVHTENYYSGASQQSRNYFSAVTSNNWRIVSVVERCSEELIMNEGTI